VFQRLPQGGIGSVIVFAVIVHCPDIRPGLSDLSVLLDAPIERHEGLGPVLDPTGKHDTTIVRIIRE
jgi:hypothetical protein